MNAMTFPLDRQNAAIHHADELLAGAGLPLYGDLSGTLARLISLIESHLTSAPDDAPMPRTALAMTEVIYSAKSMYGHAGMADPDATQPHHLVNQAFGQLPYGAGITFATISEADTKATGYETIAANLNRLADTLRAVGADNNAMLAELGQYRTAVKGLSIGLELIERERAARHRHTPHEPTALTTHPE